MKKIKVNYIDTGSKLLFSENLLQSEVPRTGEYIIWMKSYLQITRIERNYDKNEINILIDNI